MPEYNLIDTLKIAGKTLINSEVFILVILELAILLVLFLFRNVIQNKVLKTTGWVASLLVLGFYAFNYIDTLVMFMNNITTSLVELIYFPTAFEFVFVLLISFIIMIITLGSKAGTVIKTINVAVPVIISFILFGIVEYINVNSIPFDEFSVFTNPILTSLHELGMGLFISWIAGLVIYKIDKLIINKLRLKETKNYRPKAYTTINVPSLDSINEKSVEVDTRNTNVEFELPKLKR
jgi:hypothetical protein